MSELAVAQGACAYLALVLVGLLWLIVTYPTEAKIKKHQARRKRSRERQERRESRQQPKRGENR